LQGKSTGVGGGGEDGRSGGTSGREPKEPCETKQPCGSQLWRETESIKKGEGERGRVRGGEPTKHTEPTHAVNVENMGEVMENKLWGGNFEQTVVTQGIDQAATSRKDLISQNKRGHSFGAWEKRIEGAGLREDARRERERLGKR